MMTDLSHLKSGDIIFTRVRWNWKYLPSYLSRAINFMVNFWSGIQTFFNKFNKQIPARPYCPANHCMLFINNNGIYEIHESDEKGFHPVNAFERLKDITQDNIWVKRYPNIEPVGLILPVANSMRGIKYGWVIIAEQIIRQLSNEKISFVWKPWKGMVCSMTVGLFINSMNPTYCKNCLNADPQDLFFDTDSNFITVKFK